MTFDVRLNPPIQSKVEGTEKIKLLLAPGYVDWIEEGGLVIDTTISSDKLFRLGVFLIELSTFAHDA